MSQLRELATPFHGKYVKAAPQGKHGEYVSHSTINERALSVVGPHSFEVVEIIREPDGTVSGVLARLTVVIDGERVEITEAGDEEHPQNKRAGEAVKNAASDAYKRCWMRLGMGLHLWSQDDYFLAKQLDKQGGVHFGEQERYEIRDGGGNVKGTYSITTPEGTTGEIPADATPDEYHQYAENDPERPFE